MSNSRSPVVFHPGDDPEIHEAAKRARQTFKYMWRELTWEYRRIVPALELAAVKAAFSDHEDGSEPVEHMWMTDIEFNGDQIRGVLVNEPNELSSVAAGDSVALTLEELEDWMYVRDGRVYGGFTVQVTRARMNAADRRDHDDAWGFDFGDPSVVELVPNWNARGQPKPGFVGRLLGKKPPPVEPTDPDDEHPMSENMAAGLAEAVAKDPSGFSAPGDDGLTTLHSLALGGSRACVQVLLENGVDTTVRTPSGKTARDLANQMGWPAVVALLQAAENPH